MVPKEKVEEVAETLPSNLNKPFLRRALRRNTETTVVPASPKPEPPAPAKIKTPEEPTKSTLKKSKPVPVRSNSTPAPSTAEPKASKPWTLLHMRKPEDPGSFYITLPSTFDLS